MIGAANMNGTVLYRELDAPRVDDAGWRRSVSAGSREVLYAAVRNVYGWEVRWTVQHMGQIIRIASSGLARYADGAAKAKQHKSPMALSM